MATSTLLQDEDDLPRDPRRGHANSDLGHSDSSDSGSDTAGLPRTDSDTDSSGTGERVSVDPDDEDPSGGDLVPDEVVDEERVARSAPGDSEGDATDAKR